MSKEFNVYLPTRYEHNPTLNNKQNFEMVGDYVRLLHNSIEETVKRLFYRLSGKAESPTDGNIATVDEDGDRG